MANGFSSEPEALPRHPRVWWSRIKYRWPFLVWVAAIVGAILLYLQAGRTVAVSGVIEVIRETAAPLETALLLEVAVRPGEQVKPGDLLARFDASRLMAERAEVEAEMAMDQLQIERQFTRAISDAETRLRDVKLQQAMDENRLQVLQEQLKALDQVMNLAVEDASRLAFYRAEAESLKRAVGLYPATIRDLEEDTRRVREQMKHMREWAAEDTGAPSNSAAAVAANLIASFRLREEQYALRARNTGTVSMVLQAAGDTVTEGAPVVVTVVRGSQHVIGYVPEAMAHAVNIGDTALITRPIQSGGALSAHVTALGPEILALPTRVSPIPNQTIRGRRIVLVIEEENDFLPGESVNIYLNRPWWMGKYQQLLDRYAKAGSAGDRSKSMRPAKEDNEL
jgi:multidrug resistance efflux pump